MLLSSDDTKKKNRAVVFVCALTEVFFFLLHDGRFDLFLLLLLLHNVALRNMLCTSSSTINGLTVQTSNSLPSFLSQML